MDKPSCATCQAPLRIDNAIGYCRKHRNYSPAVREKQKAYTRQTAEARKKKWRELTPEERQAFREVNRVASRGWRARNQEKKKAINRRWVLNNPDKVKSMGARWKAKHRRMPLVNLCHRMASAVRASILREKNGWGWERLVGYTRQELAAHLESKFTDGMTWEVFATGAIHIDHIRPISSFGFSKPSDKEFLECWSLGNLQPLWAPDNLRKSNKLP